MMCESEFELYVEWCLTIQTRIPAARIIEMIPQIARRPAEDLRRVGINTCRRTVAKSTGSKGKFQLASIAEK
jgi:hypothetical protein